MILSFNKVNRMDEAKIRSILWWICLLVAPLVLISIELYHPAGFTHEPGAYQYLHKPQPYQPQFAALGYFGPPWWFALHMIQTPMVALVAVGLWLLAKMVRPSDGAGALVFAWLSRIETFVFLIYYTALDAIGGFGLARTITITEQFAASSPYDPNHLTPEQLDGVIKVINATWTDRWVGGVGSFISMTGSWAVFFAALSLAIALFIAKKAPWPALIILIAFGWELQESHTMPHGPIAFSLLIVATQWIWWSSRKRAAA